MDNEVNELLAPYSISAGMGKDMNDATFVDEKCGICMDVVVDRGLLDCCNHWFCFACIDNWATIMNVCPLCKTGFGLITCIPVYDTTGSLKGDTSSVSRGDDWCVEGKNNTLSFPSYYIDEDAVACLGDDGCRVRNGRLTVEDGQTLDTSVACDSCDVWYHAFCVGFDPNVPYEGSWLCPRCRCNLDKSLDQTYSTLNQKLRKQCELEVASSLLPIHTNLCGKLTVSAADSGETAVVVSLVGQKHLMHEELKSTNKILPDPGGTNPETLLSDLIANRNEESMSNPDLHFLEGPCCNNPSTSAVVSSHSKAPNDISCGMQDNLDMPSNQSTHSICSRASTGCHELPLSSLEGVPVSCPDDSKCIDRKCKTVEPINSENSQFHDSELHIKESNIDLSLGSAVQICSVQDKITNGKVNDFEESIQVTSDDSSLDTKSVNLDTRHAFVGNPQTKHQKEFKERGAIHKRRLTAENNFDLTHLKHKGNVSLSDLTSSPKHVTHSGIKRRKSSSVKGHDTCDIMDLVKEVDHDSVQQFATIEHGARASKHPENSAGVRIKKIMKWSIGDENEASQIVQKIKKEIGESSTHEALNSSNVGDLVDLKLLHAFRTAITGSKIYNNKTDISSLAKAKKSLLQKGKIRENLTRRLYGTASGRRHRAWDRDWEIEFWKHRCLHTKAKKVETLQSVLELLRKNEHSLSMELKDEKKHDGEDTDPFFSRLYLADASLLPRDENIKPLSALSASIENQKVQVPPLSDAKPSQVTTACNNSRQLSPTFHHNSAQENVASKFRLCESLKKFSVDGREQRPKPLSAATEDIKSDKKKWALAVLARKTATMNEDTNEDENEKARLQGNYPLLAQLPADMRPMVAASRQSKIPMSVRQVQLNRLTEHYLKKLSLTVIRRSAATELAVADALNIEKQICERSKSKIVYLNLCSQTLSQHVTASYGCNEAEETVPDAAERFMEGEHKVTLSYNRIESVEHALEQAGLLSNSPPNSPYSQSEDTSKKCDPIFTSSKNIFDNMLDIDSVGEADIYGDFEYDLDGDGIGLLAINSTLPKSATNVTDSKMKVVLHTLHFEEEYSNTDAEMCLDSECLNLGKKLLDSNLLAGSFENEVASEAMAADIRFDDLKEINTVLSVSEYEELYGRDEVPLEEKVLSKERKHYSYECPENQDAHKNAVLEESEKDTVRNATLMTQIANECSADKNMVKFGDPGDETCFQDTSLTQSLLTETTSMKNPRSNKKEGDSNPVYRKVEAYIKEHIRPLCKSGVITRDQYCWAVSKSADKVMQYHSKAKNADFLIKEGHKVRNLAEKYVEYSKKRSPLPSLPHAK